MNSILRIAERSSRDRVAAIGLRIVLVCLCGLATAETPIGSAFTYQGKLETFGAPTSGTRDLAFGLYDAPVGGNQIGTTASRSCSVVAGLFSTSLDFGPAAFADYKRWVQTSVGKEGSWIPLTPRTELSPAPFAGYASTATYATSAASAGYVDGVNTATTATDALHATIARRLAWQRIMSDTLAQPNGRYVVTSDALVTVRLPEFPNYGDIVAVSSADGVAWKIAQNPDQTIRTRTLGIAPEKSNWSVGDTDGWWRGIAMSSDGTKLAAVSEGAPILTSSDGGLTWTPHETPRLWSGIACSADGTKLAACVDGDQIYTSTNSGITWTPRETARRWLGITSSADGTKLAACVVFGQIYTSSDSGQTWTPNGSNATWTQIAGSADGRTLIACIESDQIYTSVDSGATWAASGEFGVWQGAACSADGSILAAADYFNEICISIDSGSSWHRSTGVSGAVGFAMSADGATFAAGRDGDLLTSRNSGASWSTAAETAARVIAISADGAKMAFGHFGGRIYISPYRTTSGTDGYLACPQGGSIELQYVGNFTFAPLSHQGAFESH